MPKVLKILTLLKDGKQLRQVSKEVPLDVLKTPKFKRLLQDMARTMKVKDGVGLAAPQIGQAIRTVVVNTKDGPLCLINPKLVKTSLSQECGEEGCLSIPKVFGQVKRHKNVTCAFINQDGQAMKMEARGFLARVIQHELDHLDGVLFIDRIVKTKKTPNVAN